MSKCWYCNEELTTANYCDKHIGICTKCYDSMFKVGNEFVKGLTDKIADLEAKLAEVKNSCDYYMKRSNDLVCEIGEYKKHIRFKGKEIVELKQQLAEYLKHHKWVSEFLERYKIDSESTPEYSKNPMIEYCEQVYDFRLCDNVEIKDLQEQLAEKENTITTLIEDSKASKELLKKEIEELKAQRHIYLTRSVDECNKITMLELELQHKDQDKISFAVDILEELADCSNYINSKLDFECGDYVSEKAIRDKIKYLKGKKDE